MKKVELLNTNVRLMIDVLKPSNLTDIELQLCNDFFNSLPVPFQKYVFKKIINTFKWWPKPAELHQVYDECVKKKNQDSAEIFLVKNAEPCVICGDTGFFEYFRYKGKVLTNREYFANIKKYFGKCTKHIGTCKCNVGRSKESSNRFYCYSELFHEEEKTVTAEGSQAERVEAAI